MGASDEVGGLDRVTANERHFLAVGRTTGAPIVLQCECTRLLCDRRIDLTREQYEPVRSSAARYAIYPDNRHVDPRVDQVLEQHTSYWVVERRSSVEVLDFFGPAAETLESELTSRLTNLRVPSPEDNPDATA